MIEDINGESEEQLSEPLLCPKGNNVRSPSLVLSDCVLFANVARFDVRLFLLNPVIFQLVSQFLTMNEVHVFMRLCSADHRAMLHSDFSFFPGNNHASLPLWVGAIKQRQYDRNMERRDQILQYVGKCWFCVFFSVGMMSLVFLGDVQMSLWDAVGIITLSSCVPFFGGALFWYGLAQCSLAKVDSAHAEEIENPLALVGQRHRYKGLSLQAPVSDSVLMAQP